MSVNTGPCLVFPGWQVCWHSACPDEVARSWSQSTKLYGPWECPDWTLLKNNLSRGPLLRAQDTRLRVVQVKHLSNPELAPGLARRIHSLGNDGGKQLGRVSHELEVPGQGRAWEDVGKSPWSRGTSLYLVAALWAEVQLSPRGMGCYSSFVIFVFN